MNIYLLPVHFCVVLCVTTIASDTTSLPDTTGILSTGQSLSTTISSTPNTPGTSSSIYNTQYSLDVNSSTDSISNAVQTDTSTFFISTSSEFVLSSLEASPTDFLEPTGSALTTEITPPTETNNSRISRDIEVTPTTSALLQTTSISLDSDNVIFGINSSSYEFTESFDTPDGTTNTIPNSVFITITESSLFTKSNSNTTGLISTLEMTATIQTKDPLLSSGITHEFKSGSTASSITSTNTMNTTSSNSTYLMDKTTMVYSFSNEMYTINSLPSTQITENSDVLSSFSSTYDSPVIATLYSSRSSSLETFLFTSEPVYSSSISITEISKVITQNGIGTTTSSEIVAQTTPVSLSVTSALDTMSTVTPLDPKCVDFQKQIEDLKDRENAYMIAVIVLVLIIAVLILVIVLYVLRRRRYYQRKQLELRGIDDDLLVNNRTPRSHFNTEQNEDLRISGRISTATLGNDDQPMKVFQSFNKSKDREQESSAESEKTILKFDDTKDEAL